MSLATNTYNTGDVMYKPSLATMLLTLSAVPAWMIRRGPDMHKHPATWSKASKKKRGKLKRVRRGLVSKGLHR